MPPRLCGLGREGQGLAAWSRHLVSLLMQIIVGVVVCAFADSETEEVR